MSNVEKDDLGIFHHLLHLSATTFRPASSVSARHRVSALKGFPDGVLHTADSILGLADDLFGLAVPFRLLVGRAPCRSLP